MVGLRIVQATVVTAALAAAGCTNLTSGSKPEDSADSAKAIDPYESLNRRLFGVNDAIDKNLLRPVASGYLYGVPAAARTHVRDILSNLNNPAQLANDVMQANPRKAGNTFMRLVINSTLGIAGLFDVASGLGYPDHDTDFGLTLAAWGVPSGPFLYLPLLGPNDPRDAIGYGANSALDPLTWASFGGSASLGWGRFGAGAISGRSRLLSATDTIDKTALDRYATYRSLWEQHRNAAVASAREDLPATTPDWYAK
jgi:phospholipid-binding lipoprotein MlaA